MAKKKRVNTEQVRIQNAAKSLVANIRFASIDKQVRSLVVTSSVPQRGQDHGRYRLGPGHGFAG